METENEMLLKQKIYSLEQEIAQLKIHLKKYTAPLRNKTYYENHKEEVIQKVKKYKETTQYKYTPTPDQKKEYNKKAYLKRKEQKQNMDENI